MKRTTIFLDEHMLKRLKQVSRAEVKSFAQTVREAVAAYVAQRPRPARRLPSWAGMFASGFTDTSERVDELLWKDPHD